MAITTRKGTIADNFMWSGGSDDLQMGMGGNDQLIDGGRYGQDDPDAFDGGAGNDFIYSHWGADSLLGGSGDDLLVSRSDAGEPVIAQNPDLPKINPDEPLANTDDTLNGGIGADHFLFRLDMNATADAIARNTDASGNIDWGAIHDESTDPHHHWVEGIGTDTIADYYRDEGDHIVIDGHRVTATIEYQDTTGDGRNDMSLITLTSDPAVIGAHTGDSLGYIKVFGNLVTIEDLTFIDSSASMIMSEMDHSGILGAAGDISEAFHWSNAVGTRDADILRGTNQGDTLNGEQGDDVVIDATRQGSAAEDSLSGGAGNDRIYSHWGDDTLRGGDGDDVLVSRSDAGEPEIAQATIKPKVEPGEPYLNANDKLTGGLGADTFLFRLDVDAKHSIIERHTAEDGTIDWHGVTGENRHVHDHWVEAIGNDTITDFYKSEGDQIVIEGHTVEVYKLLYKDTDGDGRGDTSILYLRSNQGATGAHNKDLLGHILVHGEKVTWDDIHVDSMAVTGVGSTSDDIGLT